MSDKELLQQVNWDLGTQNGSYDRVNCQLKIIACFMTAQTKFIIAKIQDHEINIEN